MDERVRRNVRPDEERLTEEGLRPTQNRHVAADVVTAAAHVDLGMNRQPSTGGLNFSVESFHAPRPLRLAAEADLTSIQLHFQRQHDIDSAIRRQVLHAAFQTQSLQATPAMAVMTLPSLPFTWARSTGTLPVTAQLLQLSNSPEQFLLARTGQILLPPTRTVEYFDGLDFDARDAPELFRSHPMAASARPLHEFSTARPRQCVASEPVIAMASHPPSSGVAERSVMSLTGEINQESPVHDEGSQMDASQLEEPPSPLSPTGRKKEVFPMWSDDDETAMTKYQCLLRRQIEYFVADHDDLQVKAQGRNKPIRLGQVGIRCRHCAKGGEVGVSAGASRSTVVGAAQARENRGPQGTSGARNGNPRRGAVYYPSRVSTLFQAVQNMACNHFASGACSCIPSPVLEEIMSLKNMKSAQSRRGAGKRYWARSAGRLGIVDTGTEEGTGGSCLVLRRR